MIADTGPEGGTGANGFAGVEVPEFDEVELSTFVCRERMTGGDMDREVAADGDGDAAPGAQTDTNDEEEDVVETRVIGDGRERNWGGRGDEEDDVEDDRCPGVEVDAVGRDRIFLFPPESELGKAQGEPSPLRFALPLALALPLP